MIKNKSLIIAEAGVNHNGSFKNAIKLVDIAVSAKADFIKFQFFRADSLAKQNAPKAKYQMTNTKKEQSHYKMLKSLELTPLDFKKIINYCKKLKIKFLASIFDTTFLNIIIENKIDFIKIPSGEITNAPLLKKVAQLKKSVFLSTGMSNLKEITEAINLLINSGTKKSKIYIMQCNTEYPTPDKDVNLNVLSLLKKEFNLKVGLSDHSLGNEAAIAAVAMGAKVIEKHVTINKKMKGPDHSSSMNSNEFINFVKAIRRTEQMLGKKQKAVSKSERKNIKIARRSIYAKNDINKGNVILESDLIMLRPNIGLSPMKIGKVIGKKSKRNFKKYDLISL